MKKLTLLLILFFGFQLTNAQNETPRYIYHVETGYNQTKDFYSMDHLKGYVITEEGERIEVHSFEQVEKRDAKLSFYAFIKNKKGKTKTKKMKLDNFKKAFSGVYEYKKISIDKKKAKVYKVKGESSQYLMLTQDWIGKYNNHVYYYLITKKGHKLIKSGEYAIGKRKKYQDQKRAFWNLYKRYKLKNLLLKP